MEFLVDGSNICAWKTVPKASLFYFMWLMQRDLQNTWDPRRPKVVQIIRTMATTSKNLDPSSIEAGLTLLGQHHAPGMNLEPVCSRGLSEANGVSFRLKQCPSSP